jgi:hypothetical protein
MPGDQCSKCGTMIDAGDPSGLCAQCGAAKEGATVEPPVEHTDTPHGVEPMETVQTEPPGSSGHDPNPELKVRR